MPLNSRTFFPFQLYSCCIPNVTVLSFCACNNEWWIIFDLISCHPDVIMDMFQAPTLLEDPFNNTSVVHKEAEPPGYPSNGKYSNILWKVTKIMQLMFVGNQCFSFFIWRRRLLSHQAPDHSPIHHLPGWHWQRKWKVNIKIRSPANNSFRYRVVS